MKTLVVIDMQNDFIDGALGTPEAQAILPNVVKKVQEYQKNKDQVIFTQDTHLENYLNTLEGKKLPIPHCIAGTPGHDIPECLNTNRCVEVMKSTFGSFYVQEVVYEYTESIEIVGLCTDICVISNALILKTAFPNIEIKVDSSCCAGTTPEAHEAALTVMRSCQIEVV